MRILLVEDDEMIGLSLSDALRREAMVVDWVREGNDAAEALAHAEHAIALIDLGLPGKSGFELIETRRAMENVALIERLNRVAVSASDVERVLARIRNTQPQNDTFEATVEAVTCVLPTQSNDYRLAVAFRLHALTLVLRHLLSVPEPPKPGMGRMVRIAAGMVAAACRCKLISVDDQPAAFDLTEFKAAMDTARPEGLSTH